MSAEQHPEFVPEWDVMRDDDGEPVTLTWKQVQAVWHAIGVVESVRLREDYESLWGNPKPNLYKSRLLGRMLVEGLPPTKTKPPMLLGGPAWWQMPGGDPFADQRVNRRPPTIFYVHGDGSLTAADTDPEAS